MDETAPVISVENSPIEPGYSEDSRAYTQKNVTAKITIDLAVIQSREGGYIQDTDVIIDTDTSIDADTIIDTDTSIDVDSSIEIEPGLDADSSIEIEPGLDADKVIDSNSSDLEADVMETCTVVASKNFAGNQQTSIKADTVKTGDAAKAGAYGAALSGGILALWAARKKRKTY